MQSGFAEKDSEKRVPEAEVISRVVGNCPSVDVVMGGVTVPCLLDTGSMVTMVAESFFHENFDSAELMESSEWLTLRAANGLEIPYVGYIDLDVEVAGECILKRGVLVVKDSAAQNAFPGILGMNVPTECPTLLPTSVKGKAEQTENVGFASVAGDEATIIPAHSMKVVAVSGRHNADTVVEEPLMGNYPHMPNGLLVTNTVSDSFVKGTFHVRLVNVGRDPVEIRPRTKVGLIHPVHTVMKVMTLNLYG